MSDVQPIIAAEMIESSILSIRDQRVILDSRLAELYQVDTKTLIRSVKRNLTRFPEDFMFQLSSEEHSNLRYQFGTSSQYGGRRYSPYVFTEQGVAMLSSVLHSERAIIANVEIIRTFVRLRRILTENSVLARKLAALENKYDAQFKIVFDTIHQLMLPEPSPQRPIGFRVKTEQE